MDEERPDKEIEAHLRQGAGREWMEEAAEDEQLTELLRRRRLDLGERGRELVHRGERVRAETGAHTFSGHVIFAGSDFASIERTDDLVEVVLDAAVWTIDRVPSGGVEQSGDALSFRARLSEIAAISEPVRIIVSDGRAIVGFIEVVATDHVEMSQNGNNVVVPIRLIVAVVRPTARF